MAWLAQPHSLLRAWREVTGQENFFFSFFPAFSLRLSLSLSNIDQPGRRSEGGGLPGSCGGWTQWLRSKEPPGCETFITECLECVKGPAAEMCICVCTCVCQCACMCVCAYCSCTGRTMPKAALWLCGKHPCLGLSATFGF